MPEPVPPIGPSIPPTLAHLPGQWARLSPPARRALLRADQRLRWQRNRPLPVEDYLAALPELAGDADALLDLIHNEHLLRLERGEAPDVAEYQARFPDLAGPIGVALQAQQAVSDLLLDGSSEPAAPLPGPPLSTQTLADPPQGQLPSPGTLVTGGSVRPAEDAAPRAVEVPGYEVLGELGRGGMGVVYQARHTDRSGHPSRS
jgi:hypothetical protein